MCKKKAAAASLPSEAPSPHCALLFLACLAQLVVALDCSSAASLVIIG